MAHLGNKLARRGAPGRTPADPTSQEPDISDADLFQSAISGTKPLSSRERVATAKHRAVTPEGREVSAHRLVVEWDGERVEARAHGVSREQVLPLRRGDVRPEATLDLHHCTTEVARRRVGQFIEHSVAASRNCVLVVPGRGLHSDGGPIIKRRVVDWLSAGVLAPHIRAFTSARAADGGAGALYVLLNRPEK